MIELQSVRVPCIKNESPIGRVPSKGSESIGARVPRVGSESIGARVPRVGSESHPLRVPTPTSESRSARVPSDKNESLAKKVTWSMSESKCERVPVAQNETKTTGGNIMWLFTKYGFFSVVNTPAVTPEGEEPEFTIRSRQRLHLANLIKSVKPDWPKPGEGGDGDLPLIWDDLGTDYEYRIYVTPEEWNTVYAPKLFESIDYPNFKSEIHRLVSKGELTRQYEDLLGEVYCDCLPPEVKEYSFEASKDRV
jgi:hypothetical protein